MLITKKEDGMWWFAEVESITREHKEEGFREVITTEPPTLTKEQTQIGELEADYVPTDNDKLLQTWAFVERKEKLENYLQKLKADLAETDYVIIKQQEATLLGNLVPYTIKDLREWANKRQAMRDKINEVKVKLKLGEL